MSAACLRMMLCKNSAPGIIIAFISHVWICHNRSVAQIFYLKKHQWTKFCFVEQVFAVNLFFPPKYLQEKFNLFNSKVNVINVNYYVAEPS